MKKNTNTFLVMAALIGIIIILFWIGRPQPGKTSEKNSGSANVQENLETNLDIPESTYDFGPISMGLGKVSHAFKVKNSGPVPITITKIYTSCMCTTATLIMDGVKNGPFGMAGHGFIPKIKKTLESGKEAEVEVIFDPAAHGPAGVGPIRRLIYLETENGEQELEIAAIVKP